MPFLDDKTVTNLSNELISDGSTKYKDSSIKQFSTNIKAIFKKVYPNEPFNIEYLYYTDGGNTDNFNKITAYINTVTITTQSVYFATILAILNANKIECKECIKEYTILKDKAVKASKDINILRPATEEEKEDIIEMSDLVSILEDKRQLADKFPTNIKHQLAYLITGLYHYIPPKRGSEYFTTNLKNPDHPNYLDMNKWQLIIRNAKTSGSVVDIPPLLQPIISQYYNNIGSEWLICLVSDKNKPMKHNNFNEFLKHNIFEGKKIGTRKLRNIYVSEMNDDPNTTVEERKETAEIMGHSVAIQHLIYTKYSDELHKNDSNPIQMEIDTTEQNLLENDNDPEQIKIDEYDQLLLVKDAKIKKLLTLIEKKKELKKKDEYIAQLEAELMNS